MGLIDAFLTLSFRSLVFHTCLSCGLVFMQRVCQPCDSVDHRFRGSLEYAGPYLEEATSKLLLAWAWGDAVVDSRAS